MSEERKELLAVRQELIETLEKMKEIQPIKFDYFKHLTTLSTGSILILVAFLEKVFTAPQIVLLAFFSIVCFAVCVVGSLMAFPKASNIVLYTTGIRMIMFTVRGKDAVSGKDGKAVEEAVEEARKGMEEFGDEVSKAMSCLKVYEGITRWFFIAGIAIFLIFAGINII